MCSSDLTTPISPRGAVSTTMVVREKLTGQPVPPSARAVVDLWRDFIDERSGERLAALDPERLERIGVHRGVHCATLISASRRCEKRIALA